MKPNVCPECGQDDIYEAGWTPMQGAVLECADCMATFPDEQEPEYDGERSFAPAPSISDLCLMAARD